MAYDPVIGSVAAWIQSDNASVITISQSSIAAVIIGGSVAASFTPPANQSVSGTVNAFIAGSVLTVGAGVPNQSVSGTVLIGNNLVASVSGSVGIVGTPAVSVQGTVFISGSVVTVGSAAPANQSVSGAVSVSNFPTTQNVSGSVVAFLGNSTNASVITVGTAVANQSVSGTIGASIIGTVPVTGFPINPSISGTVIATQGTTPWLIGSVYGNISGSVAATIIGNVTVVSSIAGGIFPISGSVSAVVTNNVTVVSSIAGGIFPISGSVAAVITNSPTVLVNNGSVVAFQGGAPWLQTFSNSSIIGINAGSVVTLSQGSVITLNQGSSILAVPVGSVITVFQSSSVITTWKDSSVFSAQQGTWRTSVTGTTAANSASIISGLGFVTMGVRNDGMGSVLAGTDGFYGPFATGSWGDQIVSLAPSSVWTSGIGSVYTGTPQPIIGSVSGRFINVTGIQVANASANNVYLTFYGTGIGSVAGSIIGYTVVPANGGSNINYPVPLRTQVSQPFQASVSGVASVLLSAQGFYSKV